MRPAIEHGDKFAAIVLQHTGRTTFREAEHLDGLGLSVWARCPFELDDHWHEYVGKLTLDDIRESNLTIIVAKHAASPGVLDGEYEPLKQNANLMYTALSILLAPGIEGARLICGEQEKAATSVRQISYTDKFAEHPNARHAVISSADIRAAGDLVLGLQRVFHGNSAARAQYRRLRWGVIALRQCLIEGTFGAERNHQAVRALDAVLKTAKGHGKLQFVERLKLILTAKDINLTLGDIYDMRSCWEHFAECPESWSGLKDEEREHRAFLRTLQSELIAREVYRRVLENTDFMEATRTDDVIDRLWDCGSSLRKHWGSVFDLDAAVLAAKRDTQSV